MSFAYDSKGSNTLTGGTRHSASAYTTDNKTGIVHLWTSTYFPWLSTSFPWSIGGFGAILTLDVKH